MASTSKGNGIREILNRGILLSLCLSLLVGSGVLIVWQWMSQVKANTYNTSLVREALQRDSADLLTSSMLKNYDAVGFQLKNALASLPIKCAYIELPGQRYAVKGDIATCAHFSQSGDGAHQEQIASGGMTIGPLVYVLDSSALPPESAIYLILSFVALVGCVVLTWAVLIKMINDAILRPLGSLTKRLSDGEYSPDLNVTCDEVVSLAEQLRQFRSQVTTSAKREEFERVARMVAHNIDTPVLVLEGVDTSPLNDKSRAIYRSALSDIKGLIHNLRAEASAIRQHDSPQLMMEEIKSTTESISASLSAPRSAPTPASLTIEHVMGLVEMAVSEKRLQSRAPFDLSFEPTASSYNAFVKVQRTELKCLLLNLLNNAIEALSGAGRASGRVTIGVAESHGLVRLTIRDDGPGIDSAVLPRLGERGVSVGKNGSGLGLHHAKTMAASWGGKLVIESELGQGACVAIELPAAPPPEWFGSEIEVPAEGCVAALDDDPIIGMVWKNRFRSSNTQDNALVTFDRGDAFKTWVRAQSGRPNLYLIDYELNGHDQNGIGIIEELGIAENSILVTGRYDDPAIQAKVRWLGIRMIPKPLLGLVPILVGDPENSTVSVCSSEIT